jgi:hypothetical protein
MEADDVSKQVTAALDQELALKEQELASTYGAFETKPLPTEQQISNLTDDKGKEEKEVFPPDFVLPEPKPADAPKPEPPKTKDALVKSILELQSVTGKGDLTDSKLRRMKKAELEVTLAGLYNKASEKAQERTGNALTDLEADSNVIVENLFLINMMMVSMMEKGSDMIKERTYGVALLEGMTGQVKSTKDELMTILLRIYKDHFEILKKFATPTALYLGYMAKTAGLTVMTNLEKKKLLPKEKSDKI